MSGTEENLPKSVVATLNEEAPIAPVDAGTPMYRIDPASKVAVSKHYGKLWQGRIDAGRAAAKHHHDAWDEAIRYYNNSQLDHREGARDGISGNRYFAKRRNRQWSETENVVYSNVRAMMPAVFTKNPQAEFTTVVDQYKPFVQCVEDLVNDLAGRRKEPGLNLKVHAKQAIISAELCNLGWFEFGYTERANSLEAVQEEIMQLEKELADAKDTKAIREAEGKLMALEESLALVTPAGPYARYMPPHDVVNDPSAMLPDFSDAKWRAICQVYPTHYLNARYGEKDENGVVKSIYKPTHVLVAGEGADDEIKNFKLFETDAEASAYGYKDKAQLQKAYQTKCWRILDKVTRRVFLYAENKWDWPVWVENDPYELPGFYNSVPLYFNTTPLGAYAHSNVVYYLDQQDGLNEINDEFRRARLDIKENILYDSTFDREVVEKWLKGPSPSANGVVVPDGKKLSDMILQKPNLLVNAMPFFDTQKLMQSINRLSGVTDVLQNSQFKTNTTNKAIENYNSTTTMRLDEKIDAIEDALGELFFGIGFLCARFMTKEEVADIIGDERAAAWTQLEPRELARIFSCQSVGGSTQKPTSAAKKQQALEMANILAQFAKYAPGTIIETTMMLFNEAFDELTLPKDWALRVGKEAEAALNKGRTDQPQQGADGAAEPQAPEMNEIAMAIDNLPPEAKIALGNVLARGVPIAEAVPEVLRAVTKQPG
jgi:hypothetical protein